MGHTLYDYRQMGKYLTMQRKIGISLLVHIASTSQEYEFDSLMKLLLTFTTL
jgi:hypothetical protein